MDLSDRAVLVTGASSGIGREVACFLSQMGARIVLVGRNGEQLSNTAAMLTGSGHRTEAFDLNAFDEIPGWLKKIASVNGPLHGLVHCAGLEVTRPLKIVTEATITEMMRINLYAAVALTKAFRMKGTCVPESSIVLLSSITGLVGQAGHAEYCASKGALMAFARSAAIELAREKIRVNCVAPGIVFTEMLKKYQDMVTEEQFKTLADEFPLGLGVPRDIANAVGFLLADTGRWITGTTLVVDGGYTAH